MESKAQRIQVKETHKKRKGDFTKSKVYKGFKETGGVKYYPMIDELSYRSHLPKWICRRVYDAEADVLTDLGLLN